MIGRNDHKEVIYQRQLVKPMEGVVQVIKVTTQSHGYDGYMGICVGHPNMLAIQNVKAAEKVSQRSLLEFLEEKAKQGSDMSASDILAVWTKQTDTTTVEDSTPASPTPTTLENPSTVSPEQPLTTKKAPSTESPTIVSPAPLATSPSPTPKETHQKSTTTTNKAAIETPKARKGPPKKFKKGKRKASEVDSDSATVVSSPIRRTEVGGSTNHRDCIHDGYKDLIPFDRAYFKPQYCEQVNYPDVCSGCKRSLLPGEDKTKHCTIRGIFTVHCCRNAINVSDHPCVFALCHECFSAKSAETRSPKKARHARSKTNALYPGEVLRTDGTIGAGYKK